VVGFLGVLDDSVPEAFASDELPRSLDVGEQAGDHHREQQALREDEGARPPGRPGEMAAGLAHEIRNPLGAIKGAAQYLDPTQLQGAGEILQIIVEEVEPAGRVVGSSSTTPARSQRGSEKFQEPTERGAWKTMK